MDFREYVQLRKVLVLGSTWVHKQAKTKGLSRPVTITGLQHLREVGHLMVQFTDADGRHCSQRADGFLARYRRRED